MTSEIIFVEDFRKQYEEGRRDFSKVILTSENFGSDFFNMNIPYINMNYGKIQKGPIYFSDISYSDLINIDLSNLHIEKCNLSYCNFKGANLTNTIFRDTYLKYIKWDEYTQFKNCDMEFCYTKMMGYLVKPEAIEHMLSCVKLTLPAQDELKMLLHYKKHGSFMECVDNDDWNKIKPEGENE